MRIIRLAFRFIRWVSVVYTLWRAYRNGKRFILVGWLWKLLRKKPLLGLSRPEIVMIDSADPRIYKRRGWRPYRARAIRKL